MVFDVFLGIFMSALLYHSLHVLPICTRQIAVTVTSALV